MEKHKPQAESTAYTGRFGDQSSGHSRSSEVRRPTRAPGSVQRPSGFGTAGQSTKSRPAAQPEEGKTEKKAPKKPKKDAAPTYETGSEKRKKHPVLKILGIILAVILAAMIVLVILFGAGNQSYHQMPKIERESVASFDPEETPMPGTEAP